MIERRFLITHRTDKGYSACTQQSLKRGTLSFIHPSSLASDTGLSRSPLRGVIPFPNAQKHAAYSEEGQVATTREKKGKTTATYIVVMLTTVSTSTTNVPRRLEAWVA